MVYASIPAYLDPPNWNQQQQQQQHHQAGGSGVARGTGGGGDDGAHHQLLGPVPPRPEGGGGGAAAAGGGGGVTSATVRPGSMADRARLARIPQPEPALKCPRCDSTNTKFCYFNNYSLSQPRHFCKTCRRYWTRGGALRNVPVGGGCRRNKRSKSSTSSKSSASNSHTGTTSTGAGGAPGGAGTIASHISAPTQLPFMSSLHPLSDYGATSIGLNYGGLHNINDTTAVDYHHMGSSSGSMGLEQWRLQQLQQLPFFAGLEQQTTATPPALGLYQFDTQSGVDGATSTFVGPSHGMATAAGLATQLASVKVEESQQGLNLSRQYLGIPSNDHFWSTGAATAGGGNASASGLTTTCTTNAATAGAGWITTDLSGFNSTTATGNLL